MVLMIPLLIDLTDKKIVIFGGGAVGERKARLFARYGKVEVASRDFTPELREMATRDEIRLREIELSANTLNLEPIIQDAFIVIPATDDENVNLRVIELAERLGILINRTDEIQGDITVPSIIEKGDITISISTGGMSPAMSKFLRKKLEREVTEADRRMVNLQRRLRSVLKDKITKQKRREEILWDVLEDQAIWDMLLEDENRAFELSLAKIG